ncbi:helix-turn-helix domain-containing protein [Streptomyces sp. NPDC088727]|uniref:helix-turn-helix domain-containing protein n=1 Tax=Streptomyces sp. NPDC088727 TaxID=3365875 RepID=UPI00382A53AE
MAQRNISLTNLAAEVGITNVNLSRLKTGKVMAVKLSTLSALCAALKCQPGDILTYAPATEPVSD